ncbi:zinc finger protein [Macleaya cordata]|uniref:Zinc finger protein n=1 Tax=Macleaya cordata TaxID=56857 RepID=A0A200R0V1_MACCD|nr:zinc finger protein [Macleaya cordata]
MSVKEEDCVKKNFVHANPSYLETLGQTYSGWIFGAIAELVDNSKDAKATKLEISVETHYSEIAGNKRYKVDDRHRIGKFGIGFKTGAMKLGRDVIVITQTTESRSVAFLSQSSNEGNDNLELPIVSYRRNDFSLEWQKRNGCKSSSNEDDILIRSRRTRLRHGQLSKKVPLDYSLRSYLAVIFLDPRMKIYVQGSLVKSRPLAKSLNETKIMSGEIMGKPVRLTLGRFQQEWERMNCGIFLYWQGRLIDRDGNHDLVHNTKQAFQECEAYAKLEEWLGDKSNEYWNEHFDRSHLKRKKVHYKPDHDWVQCDKCRKWRRLSSDFDTTTLAEEWLCSMPPYNGKCKTAEEKHVPGAVVNLGSKRSTVEDGLGSPRRYSIRLSLCRND